MQPHIQSKDSSLVDNSLDRLNVESNHHDHEGEEEEEVENSSSSSLFLSKSLELRRQANESFSSHDFDFALSLYTQAIECLTQEGNHEERNDPKQRPDHDNVEDSNAAARDFMTILLCNRSLCLYKMKCFQESKIDALQAWNLSQQSSPKAAFRLAKACLALKEYSQAIDLLRKCIPKEDRDNVAPTTATSTSSATSNVPTDAASGSVTTHVAQCEFVKLLQVAHEHSLRQRNIPNATYLSKLTSISHQPSNVLLTDNGATDAAPAPAYVPSIRHFDKLQLLGEGNYSQVFVVRHIVTNEQFALKILDKSRVQQLAKRQHPNVYNEIEMEKRVLGKRLVVTSQDMNKEDFLQGSKRIVRLYYTFQDYNHLYYLMDLPSKGLYGGGDLWSTLRFRSKMVGTHPSLAKVHLGQLLQALEFIHSRGIVHRDLKAENLLVDDGGHLLLIDFGTAKDLIEREYNGPEFVGTPDFMAPEVLGGGDKKKKKKKEMKTENDFEIEGDSDEVKVDYSTQGRIGGADHTLDLWAFGCVAYQIMTGTTPFASPSQYLAFLKIQRGILCRPMGVVDDHAWDLIVKLIKVNPRERLGAECFEYVAGKDGERNRIVQQGQGYDHIWSHPYFADFNKNMASEGIRPIPTLRDLCIRACAELVQNDSTNLEIDKLHPPGDNSSHDMLRLSQQDRGRVMDFLDRLRILSQPRVFRRFFRTKQEARLGKVRNETRDFIGLTQINDKQYQFPMKDSENMDEERSDVIETIFPIRYMHISNPLFDMGVNMSCSQDQRTKHISALKDSLKTVNRMRPKIVVVSGYLDDECRKLIGKVNESIPVALNDGASFYSFWSCGGQGLVLRSSDFVNVNAEIAQNCEQAMWLKQELEQCRMTRHHLFAFVDCNPDQLPSWLIRLLTKGRTQCLFGINNEASVIEKVSTYLPRVIENSFDASDDDDDSVSSLESDIENEEYNMRIVIRGDASLRCWHLEEFGEWEFHDTVN